MKRINIAIKYTLYFILLLIINLFFYSLISIALYKIICNETTYNYLLENSNYINKYLNIYVLSKEVEELKILDEEAYTLEMDKIVWLTEGEKVQTSQISEMYVKSYTYSSLGYLENELLISKYSNLEIIHLSFFIRSSNLNIVSAWTLQKILIVNLNETSLFFFRIYNPTHLKLELITLYIVYPNEMSVYVNKIQCFCFNVLYIYPSEILDLPVLIYIVSYIPYIVIFNVNIVTHIIIYYVIFLN